MNRRPRPIINTRRGFTTVTFVARAENGIGTNPSREPGFTLIRFCWPVTKLANVTAAPPARVAVHATGRGRSGLAVLGNRSFVAILTARSISVAGNGFHFVAVSWLVLQLHGTVADLGVLLAASVVPGILLSLAGG